MEGGSEENTTSEQVGLYMHVKASGEGRENFQKVIQAVWKCLHFDQQSREGSRQKSVCCRSTEACSFKVSRRWKGERYVNGEAAQNSNQDIRQSCGGKYRMGIATFELKLFDLDVRSKMGCDCCKYAVTDCLKGSKGSKVEGR